MARKKRKSNIIPIIIIALVAGGILFYAFSQTPEGANMVITFYDELGKVVGTTQASSVTPSVIVQEGFDVEIHSMKVVVYFKITGDKDEGTTETRCWLNITTIPRGYGASAVNTIATHELGVRNSDLSGSFYRGTNDGHYFMYEILPLSAIDAAGKSVGWIVVFKAVVKTSSSADGLPLHAEHNCGTTLQLVWKDTEMQVEGWFGDVP